VVAAPGSRVAERVAWFYAVHPRGRIITDLVTRAREVAVFRAALYREAADALPAATGWSSGNPAGGQGLERVEEAAVGRALANLGFAVLPVSADPAGPGALAARLARARLGPGTEPAAGVAAAAGVGGEDHAPGGATYDAARAATVVPWGDAAPTPGDAAGASGAGAPAHRGGAERRDAVGVEHRMLTADLLALVARAERYGVRAPRAARWRARLRAGVDAPAVLGEAERRLRAWVERRRAEPYAGAV
jgi:hypothetical protein